MSAENVALVRLLFDEIWNARRGDLIEQLMDEQSVCYTDDGPLRGPDDFRRLQYEPFLAAFPGLHVQVDDVVCDGDQVIVRWTATGLHDGEGLGFPPTQRAATFRGVSWIRVRDGKLAEGWQYTNVPEVVRGLASPA